MKNELLKLLKKALENIGDKYSRSYRPQSAKEERTEQLLIDLIDAIKYI